MSLLIYQDWEKKDLESLAADLNLYYLTISKIKWEVSLEITKYENNKFRIKFLPYVLDEWTRHLNQYNFLDKDIMLKLYVKTVAQDENFHMGFSC